MDFYIGKVLQGGNGIARYRVIFKDSDGTYILRSLRSPEKVITLREIDIITKWRVIA